MYAGQYVVIGAVTRSRRRGWPPVAGEGAVAPAVEVGQLGAEPGRRLEPRGRVDVAELDLDGPQASELARVPIDLGHSAAHADPEADLLQTAPDRVRPQRLRVRLPNGDLDLGPRHAATRLDRDPGRVRRDAHARFDVALAGEVALPQGHPDAQLEIRRRLGDQELALDLDTHPASMRTAGTVPRHMDAVTSGRGDGAAEPRATAGRFADAHQAEPGIPLDGTMPAADGFRLVLANLADAIELNRPGAIDGLDPEFLHDLRVSVRRSRTVARHGRRVLPAELLAWAEPGLRAVAQLTSRPRDLDVQVLTWSDRVGMLAPDDIAALEPLRRQVVADRIDAHATLSAALTAGATSAVLDRWLFAVRRPWVSPGARGADALADVVRARVKRAQRQVLEGGRAVHRDSPAAAVHDVRKDAKQLRYLLECFAALLPTAARTEFVRRLKQLQDVLGDHQDADVQASELRRAAERLPATTDATTLTAIDLLVGQLDARRLELRGQFASRFADYDSRPTRRAFRAMVRSAPA